MADANETLSKLRAGFSRQSLKAKLLTGIGGFAAAAISLGVSLYQLRNPAPVPNITAGQTIEAGRWLVTPNSAALATALPDGRPVKAGRRAVVLELLLANRTERTSNAVTGILKLTNIAGAEGPDFYLVRDKERLMALQPRLPERLQAVWTLPAEAALPKALELTVAGATFKPKDSLYGAPGWFNPHDVARVSVPLDAAGSPG
ncbi:hypothetical protein C5L14_07795 [Labrys okinawensis]|uniref:DUF4352 domain-containing protein n=1 Tax=Labrys okinawensis TaxID=346911 RepID=A0A2S9QET8_9HYPH|nr:hypothetical protein [Labrys okinawensis]PRH87810.1 hypothetical protein C5L14_07795 [Labrys okinawensis]